MDLYGGCDAGRLQYLNSTSNMKSTRLGQCLGRIAERYRMIVCWDSVNQNCTGASYMLNKLKLRTTIWWDPLHRVWRALWTAAQHSGDCSMVLISGLVANNDRGPWQAEGNRRCALETCTNWLAMCDEDVQSSYNNVRMAVTEIRLR